MAQGFRGWATREKKQWIEIRLVMLRTCRYRNYWWTLICSTITLNKINNNGTRSNNAIRTLKLFWCNNLSLCFCLGKSSSNGKIVQWLKIGFISFWSIEKTFLNLSLWFTWFNIFFPNTRFQWTFPSGSRWTRKFDFQIMKTSNKFCAIVRISRKIFTSF